MIQSKIKALLDGNILTISIGDKEVEFDSESIIVSRVEKNNLKVLNEGSLTVALDPNLTQDLIQEGIVRDIVRNIQNIRRDKGFNVVDRIDVVFSNLEQPILEAIEAFKDYLQQEILAHDITWEGTLAESFSFVIQDTTINGYIEKKQ